MLSDMLLISIEIKKREILLRYLYLDHNSTLGAVEDGQYLENVITVIGKNGIVSFYTTDKETKEKIYQTLEDIT